ncbi:MAG: alpha/beta hydrolase, partial [bacterium]
PPDEIQLIFGAKDTATPPQLLLDKISSVELKNRFAIIENGDHNIGQNHPSKIREIIKEFAK